MLYIVSTFSICLVNTNVTSFVSPGFILVFAKLALYAFPFSDKYQSLLISELNLAFFGK